MLLDLAYSYEEKPESFQMHWLCAVRERKNKDRFRFEKV